MQKEYSSVNYHIGDYYLIYNDNYKANKYIGKVKVIGQNEVTLNIYLFPEDTKEGRKPHMSYYEVFYTEDETRYQFSGDEILVEVTNIKDYVNRKYIKKEIFKCALYYQRQNYTYNKNFEPELPRICYCKEYFNPDNTFKICKCGNYFHSKCFMQSESNKCWFKGCSFDCSEFFTQEELIDKKVSHKSYSIKKQCKSVEIKEKDFIKNSITKKNTVKEQGGGSDIISLDEIAEFSGAAPKNKKIKETNGNNFYKIDDFINKPKHECVSVKKETKIDLGVKVSSPPKTPMKLFSVSNEDNNKKGIMIKEEEDTTAATHKRTENARESARKIIYENLMEGIKMLQENKTLMKEIEAKHPNLDNISLIKENNELLISIQYKELATSIEAYLFQNEGQKLVSTYYDFLQEFGRLKKDSIELLCKIILGELKPEQVSKFKGDDFLSEEKRKEKEALKRKEFKDMVITEPAEIRVISNKGRMLSEVQDIIGVEKIINYSMPIEIERQISLYVEEKPYLPNGNKNPRYPYYLKLKKINEKFPNMNENDIKFLADIQEPDEKDIQNKLSSIIQGGLGIEEQQEFFNFRTEKLRQNAEIYNKNNNGELIGGNKDETDKKFENYIKNISFDIKYY